MTETLSPFHCYSDDRLRQAQETVRARVTLAERNLERVLAHEQRAQAATTAVRGFLARAQGDARLIEAILKERETLFEEDEKEGAACTREGESCTKVQRKYTPPYLDSMEEGVPPPEPPRGPVSVSSPESLRQRHFSRSAFP